MSFCSRCGVTLSEGAAVCPNCGQSTTGTSAATSTGTLPGAVPPVTPEKTSGMAIASLVCSFLFCLVIPSILAVIFGHLSLSEIKKSAGRLGGKGIATAGLVLGYVGVAFIPVLIIAAIAIPNLLRARMAANESAAMSGLRTVVTAQVGYQSNYPDAGYAPDLASLGGAAPCTPSPATACLIDQQLATASAGEGKVGYRFFVASSSDGKQYFVRAVPVNKGQTGTRSFCSTDDGVVRVDPSGNNIPDYDSCAALAPI